MASVYEEMLNGKKLYDALKEEIKERGIENLPKELLTESVLYQLWVKEICSDNMIADLFGLTGKQVAYRRTKYGMNKWTCMESMVLDVLRKI